jgi:ATP-binding cassette, subfamily C, bacteriocin exporter
MTDATRQAPPAMDLPLPGETTAPHRPGPFRSRFPHVVRQHDSTDCGPAALLSVLRYWGGDTTLARVRDLAGTNLRGTSLVALVGAAKRLGFVPRAVRGSLEDLEREALPCIAHLVLPDGRAHFVVVHRIRPDHLLLGDPGLGRVRLSRQEFEERWRHGVVVLLRPGESLPDESAPGWIRWIAEYLRAERGWLVQSLFLGSVSAGLGLATALFVQWLIDHFIPGRDTEMILATGIVLLGLLLVRAGAAWLRLRFLLGMNRRVSDRLNRDFLTRLFKLPMRFFESRATGDISARLADGVRVQGALLEVVGTAVIDGMIIIGSITFLFFVAPPLGWIALIAVPPYACILVLAASRVRDARSEAMSAYSSAESGFIDTLRGMSELVAFGAAEPFVRMNNGLHRAFQHRAEKSGRLQAMVAFLTEAGGGVVIVAALVYGALLVVDGVLQLGELMAGYSLLAGILPSIQRVADSTSTFQEASVGAARLRELLRAPPEEPGGSRELPEHCSISVREGVVQWPSGERSLDGIDLTVRPHRTAGVWGPNGAGKSTLLSILARSRALSSGSLSVDEIPAEDHSLMAWRRSVALVPAEPFTFRGTLAENVLLGRSLPDPARALRDLETMGFDKLLRRLPESWNTLVGEGGRRLSTGECQAVALMRAMVGSPSLLLIDEGLRSTDAEMTEVLMETILRYGRARSVVMVSHEPAILARCDHLHVIDGGRITLEGPPLHVIRSDPRLRKLADRSIVSAPPPGSIPSHAGLPLGHGPRHPGGKRARQG